MSGVKLYPTMAHATPPANGEHAGISRLTNAVFALVVSTSGAALVGAVGGGR
jgi:hypothetical protein